MQQGTESKRLFFGFEINALWPQDLPKGRILEESCRHMTLAFLGQTDYAKLTEILPALPVPPFKVGQVGHFDRCLFLPENHPRVVAWHLKLLNPKHLFESYYKEICQWLKDRHFHVDERDHFLPHATLCRAPFQIRDWKSQFHKLPFMTKDLHLYESLGQLQYKSCWSYSIKPPFEEIEHTADIAFRIHGDNLQDLLRNAFMALAFKHPQLLAYSVMLKDIEELDDIIIHLNDIIGKADMDIGCPYKAVSYHGKVHQEQDQTLTWEMIVDV